MQKLINDKYKSAKISLTIVNPSLRNRQQYSAVDDHSDEYQEQSNPVIIFVSLKIFTCVYFYY